MPRHANLADHFKAKWQGQLARCKEQASEIHLLNETIEVWKKDFLDKHSQRCKDRQEIAILKKKVKELEGKVVDSNPD